MLNYRKRRFWLLGVSIVIMLAVGIGLIVNSVTKGRDAPGEEISLEIPEKSAAEILKDLADQPFSVNGNQMSDDDQETVVAFGQAFVNLYTGAVAEQETVSFRNYISNENLLKYTNKMLELEQRKELKGAVSVHFGLENEFKEAEFKKLDGNLYYVSLPFSNQGSGMNLQVLVQAENKALKIVDLYFGNKDGIDSIATGHPADRKLHDPKLWDDQVWVDGVFEKLEKIEI
ncbi:hypothetical protein ABEW34_26010 [Paenibacillus algorifonticola]|uniref:hypothetical protein n=1 Tax=Paenibacillus algorifonticola TaxID=684063 RepID=UPI003D29F6E7